MEQGVHLLLEEAQVVVEEAVDYQPSLPQVEVCQHPSDRLVVVAIPVLDEQYLLRARLEDRRFP